MVFVGYHGSWMNMQLFARGWYIYQLTESPLAIGWVSFGAGLPLLLLSPFAGVFIDRWEKRDVMIVTQLLTTLMLLSVALLIVTDTVVRFSGFRYVEEFQTGTVYPLVKVLQSLQTSRRSQINMFGINQNFIGRIRAET